MANTTKKVLHKRSVIVENELPKLPTSSQLEYGELAINYADGYETISIKNNNNEIVTFSNDNTIQKMINDSLPEIVTDKEVFSGLTQSGSIVDAYLVKEVIRENELVTSTALNDLNDRANNLTTSAQSIDTRLTALENEEVDLSTVASSVTVNGTTYAVSNGGVNIGSYLSASTVYISGITLNGSAVPVTNKVANLGNVVTAITINESAMTPTNGTLNLGNYIPIEKELTISSAFNDLNDRILTVSGEVETKQDTLVSGTNIKTINNQSLLGSGNIDIQGGGGESYTAGTNIDITNNVISVTGITVPTSNSAFTNDAGYVTSGNVKTQVEAYHYISAYTETDPTVPSWAKEQNKPSYTASEVGAMSSAATLDNVPDGTTRKLSNYALQADFSAHTGNTQVHLPVVTSEDEGKIMRVVNGVWTLVSPSTIYSGPYAPDSNIGNNGDLYLQTT